jgi:hypothetical protein
MRARFVLPLFVFAAIGLPAASAEDGPATYTIPKKETWKVGDVATREESQVQTEKTVVTANGQVVQDRSTSTDTSFVAVLRCDEVNDAGDYTKALVWFKAWKQVRGDTTDESLTGAHVEVEGASGKRTARVVTPDFKPSIEAAQWLDKELGAGDKDDSKSADAFLPAGPVAVGESWTPDIAKVGAMFGEDDKLKVVADKSKTKGTLVAVDGGIATLAWEFDLQTGAIKGPMGEMSWKEGGVFKLRFGGRKALDAGDHAGEMAMDGHLSGVVSAQGAEVALDVKLKNSGKFTKGGEIPALPKAEPAVK